MREEGQFGKVLKSQTSLSDREAVFELVSIIFWKYLVWLEELLAEDESLLGNLFYKKQKPANRRVFSISMTRISVLKMEFSTTVLENF